MEAVNIAVIGGSGIYDQSFISATREVEVETAYGRVLMHSGEYRGRRVYFLARHGGKHSVPPHMVNYRANIAALKKMSVSAIISTAAVGTMRGDMPPDSRVIVDQFIDFTKSRPSTFYDGSEGTVVHADLSEPYCPSLRKAFLRAGVKVSQELIDGGCYVCTEGPRLETPAEIEMFRKWGGDLVGMTSVPEVVLAREAGICYATIALPTNYAAGISNIPITHEDVLKAVEKNKAELDRLIAACIEEIPLRRDCRCSDLERYWKD
ncbi:MAG TPA: S-methyl-5'-thioadenosine phosphorylase [Firmicutes bacterium]|nr:S-methyl-5'-thioadenosine phosphorylase [Bacillota bacterium]